jgi:hypothetical protein
MLKKKEELINDMADYLPERRYSFVDDLDTRILISREIKEKRRKAKKIGFIKKHFSNSHYFRNLFPSIKE